MFSTPRGAVQLLETHGHSTRQKTCSLSGSFREYKLRGRTVESYFVVIFVRLFFDDTHTDGLNIGAPGKNKRFWVSKLYCKKNSKKINTVPDRLLQEKLLLGLAPQTPCEWLSWAWFSQSLLDTTSCYHPEQCSCSQSTETPGPEHNLFTCENISVHLLLAQYDTRHLLGEIIPIIKDSCTV